MYSYATEDLDCMESSPPSSWASNEMDIIIAVLFLFIALLCVPCCIAIAALVIRSCICQSNTRGHFHLSHSVAPTAATPNFRRYRTTPTDQPRGDQEQGQHMNQAQENDAHVVYVHQIDLEHVDHSYDCDSV